jgi:hypothetical protein
VSVNAKGIGWRRINNVLHRDIGYLVVGLTIVYGVSGVAVNHVADWNPSYTQEEREFSIDPITATDREEIISTAMDRLGLTAAPRNVYRPDPETLQLFFEGKTYSVDLPTGGVYMETVRPRPVLEAMNRLHLNAPKKAWTWIADAYAVSLLVVAVTGMFVLKGKTGITGRGLWLTAAGTAVPVGYWLFELLL